jgi:hypothetical protein
MQTNPRGTIVPSDEPLLSVKQGATRLGYSPSGMRKLIERSKTRLQGYPVKGPTIRFFQPSPGDEIKFRMEWLQDFIDACTHDPDTTPLKTLVAKPKRNKDRRPGSIMRAMSSSGFNPELLAL